MFINFYSYNLRKESPQDIYALFQDFSEAANLKFRYYDMIEFLPPEKSDHPGDFHSVKVTKKELENGLNNGNIVSFNVSNKSNLNDPEILVCYLNDKRHGGINNLTVHAQLTCISQDKFFALSDFCAAKFLPEYGFCAKTRAASAGIKYAMSSFLYKNEIINFPDYLLKNKHIYRLRMAYERNYVSSLQVTSEKIKELMIAMGDNFLQLADDVWMWSVPENKLQDANQKFGNEGLLISWSPGK